MPPSIASRVVRNDVAPTSRQLQMTSNGIRNVVLAMIGVAIVTLFILGRDGPTDKSSSTVSASSQITPNPTNFRITADTLESIPAKLMLMRTPNGKFDFSGAVQQCQNSFLLGYRDWRVPSVSEMRAFANAPGELNMNLATIFGGPEVCGSHRMATHLFMSDHEMRGNIRHQYVMHCSYGNIATTQYNSAVICIRNTGSGSVTSTNQNSPGGTDTEVIRQVSDLTETERLRLRLTGSTLNDKTGDLAISQELSETTEVFLNRNQKFLVENKLELLNWGKLEIDGEFDVTTRQAIRLWQNHNGHVPSGYLSESQFKALMNDNGRYDPSR